MPETRIRNLEDVTGRLEGLTTDLTRARWWLKLLGWVLAVDIVLSVVVGYVSYQDYQFRKCMQTWAADFTDRTNAVNRLQGSLRDKQLERDRAFDRLSIDTGQAALPGTPPAPQKVLYQDYQALVDAATAYETALDNYAKRISTVPIPEAPTCGALFG